MSTVSNSISTKLRRCLGRRGKTTRQPKRITRKSRENSRLLGKSGFGARRLLAKRSRTLDVASRDSHSLPHLFDYLMNALSRKVELVRDKAKRFSASMKFQNLGVSVQIRLRPWAQRPPLPTRNLLEFLHPFAAQLSLASTLAKITNPGAERQRGAINVLDVRCRNSAMSFARGELINGCNCEVETRDVVHAANNNINSNIK